MTDWAKLLTTGDAKEQASAEAVDWAREITKPASIGPAQSKMPTGYAEPREVSFGTHFQAGIVDKPQSKIEIYARELGLPPERFGVDKQGEIFYIDVDGLQKRVTQDTTADKFSRGVADTAANAPSIILGTAGSLLGPWGSAAGSAIGEFARKITGRLAYNEPSTNYDVAGDVLKQGAFGYAGDKIGGKVIGLIDAGKGKEASRLMRVAGRDVNTMDPAEMARKEAEGRTFGRTLTPIEITGSRRLSNRLEMLGQMDVTADEVQALRASVNKENFDAIEEYLNKFAPPTTTSSEAGRRGIEAANAAIKAENTARQNAAGPYYRRAFESGIEVDVKPVIEFIEDEMKTAKGPVLDNLAKAKKILEKPDLPKQGMVTMEGGGEYDIPVTRPGEVSYETNLEGLHGAKMALDDLIDSARQSGLGNTVKRNYTLIKKKLLEQMDAASPDYKQARSIFSEESAIPEMLEGTKIAKLAGLTGGDDASRVASILLKPGPDNSPEAVAIAMHYIVRHGGPEARDALIRTRLSEILDQALARNSENVGFWFAKILNDPRQKKILEVATEHNPMIMENLNRFAEIMDRSKLVISRKEAITATRQEEIKKAKKEGFIEPVLSYVENLELQKPGTWLGLTSKMQNIREALFGQRNLKIVKAMESPVAAQQMQQMLRLDPKSRQFIEALSTFSTMVLGDEFAPVVGRGGLYGQRSRSPRIKPTQEGRLQLP